MNRFSTLFAGALLSGLLVLTASCDKKDPAVTPITNTPGGFVASFVGVRFVMTDFTLDQPLDLNDDGTPDTDLTQFLRPCDLDNTVVFERNGTLSGDAGTLSCNDGTVPSPSKPDHWTYDQDTKILRITDGDDNSVSEWKVMEASEKYLKVKVAITEDGQSLGATMTWKSA